MLSFIRSIHGTARLFLFNAAFFAAHRGFAEIVETLATLDANVNNRWQGRTPIMVALVRGHSQVVEILQRYGADLSAADQHNLSVIDYFVYFKQVNALRNVHKESIAKAVLIASKRYELFDAIERDELEQARKCLSEEISPNVHDPYERTPLLLAVQRGNLDIVQLLIKFGADINLGCESGRTALMEAAYRGHEKIVEILLAAGADPTMKMSDGAFNADAAFFGRERNHTEIQKKLQAAITQWHNK